MRQPPPQPKRFVDGLVNPKAFHRPLPPKRKPRRRKWTALIGSSLAVLLLIFVALPRVQSVSRQFEILETLLNGRYLVLFQNDAEIRASGGFIGSLAVVEAHQGTVKPLYFETNIYKLDDPFNARYPMEPPKPLKAAIGSRGWGLRDANFAARWPESAQTVLWFFDQETRTLTGPKKDEITKALGSQIDLDGVIGTNLSAFLDILETIGPVELPQYKMTVSRSNFFPLIQQYVERDYFIDPTNKVTNEPKTILQDLFPLAMSKLQDLPRTTQYKLAAKLLREKKVIIYVKDPGKQELLVDQGWAGDLQVAADQRPKGPTDELAIIRSSHGGNKSSLDINPIYRYVVTSGSDNRLRAKLEIRFEHTGTGDWPSGVNHEYLRVLTPKGAQLVTASRNGQDVIRDLDQGEEAGRTAFGFWLHTQPQSSQSITLEYILDDRLKSKDYQLTLFRQPGGNDPDIQVAVDKKELFAGRLSSDRIIGR